MLGRQLDQARRARALCAGALALTAVAIALDVLPGGKFVPVAVLALCAAGQSAGIAHFTITIRRLRQGLSAIRDARAHTPR